MFPNDTAELHQHMIDTLERIRGLLFRLKHDGAVQQPRMLQQILEERLSIDREIEALKERERRYGR